MPAKGWQRRFEDLIELPSGRRLATLHDAASFITAFPKAESDQPEWQDAIEALILVATSGGPTIFARIGIMRALKPRLRSGV